MNVVFVAPFFLRTTLRFVGAVAGVSGVSVTVVSQEPKERIPSKLARNLTAYLRVPNAFDAEALADAVGEVERHAGKVHRVLGALEELQEPLAVVRERFDIPGMDVETARNFRDKARMKSLLREAGIPCARHALVRTRDDAVRSVESVGFPVVVKPPAGAGAKSTYRLDGADALGEYLNVLPLDPEHPVLFEEFMTGREHSFDSVCVDGRPVWHSISRYHPAPLEVLRNPWIQWCVILPRDIDSAEYESIRGAAFQSLETLGLETGLTHMEWFRREPDGVAISEVAARPPGAQFTTLISYAYDVDFYAKWARLMVLNEFHPPRRAYAAGAVFLRGQGTGRVRAIRGLEQAQHEVGALVVESRLPAPGQPASGSYEGDGYVIVRHEDTKVVEHALDRVLRLVRVELG